MRLGILLVSIFFLSGCNLVSKYLPIEKFRTIAPEKLGTAEATPETPSSLPNGTYKVTKYFCNGTPPVGDYLTELGMPTQIIEDSKLTVVYSYPGCQISFSYQIELNSGSSIETKAVGNIQCSDAIACAPYIKRAFSIPCGTENKFASQRQTFEKKSDKPATFLVTSASTACSYTKSGSDPMSVEMTSQ